MSQRSSNYTSTYVKIVKGEVVAYAQCLGAENARQILNPTRNIQCIVAIVLGDEKENAIDMHVRNHCKHGGSV